MIVNCSSRYIFCCINLNKLYDYVENKMQSKKIHNSFSVKNDVKESKTIKKSCQSKKDKKKFWKETS